MPVTLPTRDCRHEGYRPLASATDVRRVGGGAKVHAINTHLGVDQAVAGERVLTRHVERVAVAKRGEWTRVVNVCTSTKDHGSRRQGRNIGIAMGRDRMLPLAPSKAAGSGNTTATTATPAGINAGGVWASAKVRPRSQGDSRVDLLACTAEVLVEKPVVLANNSPLEFGRHDGEL